MSDDTIRSLNLAAVIVMSLGDTELAEELAVVADQLQREEDIKALGDLSAVKRAFESAESACCFFGLDFDTTTPLFQEWTKRFFDAARESLQPKEYATPLDAPKGVELVDNDGDHWRYNAFWDEWQSDDQGNGRYSGGFDGLSSLREYGPYTEVFK